jgi:hypothetical protein
MFDGRLERPLDTELVDDTWEDEYVLSSDSGVEGVPERVEVGVGILVLSWAALSYFA